jgi:hypothetical protein
MALEGRPSSGPKGRQGASRVTWLDPVPRPTRRRTSTGSQDGALFTSLVRSSELHGGFFAPFETRMVVQRIILAPVWLGHHWPLGQYHVVRSALTIVGSCPKRVKRRPSGAADLGLFTPQQRTSEDDRHAGPPLTHYPTGFYFRASPLNELARSKPSDVMSRNSTSA